MNKFTQILVAMVLILAVLLMFIQLNNKINNQADLIIRLSNEKFTTSTAAYNQAASFTTTPNYLMTSAANAENVKEAAYFLPDSNATRSFHPMNSIATSNNQMNIPDSNSIDGYYASTSFPGAINYGSKLIEGANVKKDKVPHTENAPVSVQNNHVANIEETDADAKVEQFSVNGRQSASASRQFMIPSKNMSQKKIRNAFSKVPSKIGKL